MSAAPPAADPTPRSRAEFVVRDLGRRPLEPVWAEMRAFTEARSAETRDEIWFVEHPPVFTLGLNADRSHLIAPGDVPVVQIDRGGQVTYHGPGQVVAYVLADIRRLNLNVRTLVQALESAVVDTVAAYGIDAQPRRDAPGVYVGGRKLAAIGLRLRRYCSYHGLALNVAMDLSPFRRIHPCGYADLEVTQIADLCDVNDPERVRRDLEPHLVRRLTAFAAGP
ncbi:MAG TPA: lipoyl(octanoyl) transferase LipB [Gammaproteobacteria bacterium]